MLSYQVRCNAKKLDSQKEFILIDDSKIDLLILERLLKINFPLSNIIKFSRTDLAFQFIKGYTATKDAFLFLDINMPLYNGFDFLDLINQKSTEVRNHYKIYMITSSLNATDIARCKSYFNVLDVINKPINHDILLGLRLQ